MEMLFSLLFALFGITSIYAGIVFFADTTRTFQGLHIAAGAMYLLLSVIFFAGVFV